MEPKIFVDFHNCDKYGRVRLTTIGTIQDLNKYGIILKRDLKLWFDDEEGNCIKGTVDFSDEEKIWLEFWIWMRIRINNPQGLDTDLKRRLRLPFQFVFIFPVF